MPKAVYTYLLNIYIYIYIYIMICKHIFLITFLETKVKGFQVLQYNSPNLTSVICLHIVCSIWLIDRTLIRVIQLQIRVDLGAMAMKASFVLPKFPRLELRHQIVYSHVQDSCWVSDLTFLPRCSQCFLQHRMSLKKNFRVTCAFYIHLRTLNSSTNCLIFLFLNYIL